MGARRLNVGSKRRCNIQAPMYCTVTVSATSVLAHVCAPTKHGLCYDSELQLLDDLCASRCRSSATVISIRQAGPCSYNAAGGLQRRVGSAMFCLFKRMWHGG